MEILVYELPPIGTNAWLLLAPERGEAVLVDAPALAWESIQPALAEKGCKLTALWLTHGHWDHMMGAAEFARHGVPVWAHRGDEILLREPRRMSSYTMPGLPEFEPVAVTRWLEHGERFRALGMNWEVRHVPGHSQGSILFWQPEAGIAVSGDVVFQGSVGRTDFPGCSGAQLLKSIRDSVLTLPDHTRLLPAPHLPSPPPTIVVRPTRNSGPPHPQ